MFGAWVLIEFSFALNIHSVNFIMTEKVQKTGPSHFEKAHMKDRHKKIPLSCRLGSVRTVIPTVPPTTSEKDRAQNSPLNDLTRPDHPSTIGNAGARQRKEGDS